MKSVTIADRKMSYVDEGQGPVLLLVHGFPLDHQMWKGQIAHFTADRRVVAPDLRGFGQSPSTDECVTMRQFADDLASLLDQLEIDQVDFCGLSMGGYIGWQFLTGYRDRVRQSILCDTRAAADPPSARDGRLQMADRVMREGSAFVAEALLPKIFSARHVEQDVECVRETRRIIQQTAPIAIAAAQRGMAERPDMTPSLPSIDVPSMLICGAEDTLTPAAEMKAIAEAMPRAEFLEVDHAGHMAPLEQPDIVNRAIRQFLD